MKRNVLGKGLDALLPEPTLNNGLRQIDIDLIQPNGLQPRMQVGTAHIEQLAKSISENGVLQPIVVRRRTSDNAYELIAGERRWRAAQRAGLSSLPAVIQSASDEKMLELALVENIQREDLTAIEEAHAYQVLVETFHLSQEDVALRVGRSRSAVANTLRLLNLPKSVQHLLLEGTLAMGHARALLPLPASQQKQVAERVARRSLSVRQTERLVQRLLHPAPKRKPASSDPHVRAAQQRLEERFQTKIEIQQTGRGTGRLVFHFHNEEELARLFEALIT